MSFLFYCLGIFFGFHLLNHSDIAAPFRNWLYPRLHEKVAYAMSCAFCLTSWITLIIWVAGFVPIPYLFAAPVVNLFLVKIYDHLSDE